MHNLFLTKQDEGELCGAEKQGSDSKSAPATRFAQSPEELLVDYVGGGGGGGGGGGLLSPF